MTSGKVLKSLNVLGLNSGTSMDGIDAALFKITPGRALDGEKSYRQAAGKEANAQACGVSLEVMPSLGSGVIGGVISGTINSPEGPSIPLSFELLHSELVPFETAFKRKLEEFVSGGRLDLKSVCLAHSALGSVFGRAAQHVQRAARRLGHEVDLIGSHGQTVWHEPRSSSFWGMDTTGTLQLGDPAYVAALTGVTTVGDFRTFDLACGGQGAPLLSFADEVLFGKRGEPCAVLNLGGIANLTVISEEGQAVMAFDTGPANVLIDEAMRKLYGQDFDQDGKVALSGTVDQMRLKSMLEQESYFKMPPPKTTGRELFSKNRALALVEEWTNADLAPADIVATLTAFTAHSLVQNYVMHIKPHYRLRKLILGGGGAYNPVLLDMIKTNWGEPVDLLMHEDFGVSAKFKEALLFALLAYTTYFGVPNNVPVCTGAKRRVCLGKLVRSI